MAASKATGTKSRSRRGGAPGSPALTRELIVETALAYIDREGLDSFSLRNLANELGVYPTAVYWYVPNRNELMGQVVALVLAKVLPAKKRRSWQHFLRDLFTNFRTVIRQHPNVAPLVGSQLVSNTNVGLELVEQILTALTKAGLAGPELVGAYNTVIAALVGFTAQEFAPVPTEDSAAWQATVRDRLASISRDSYPTLSANLALLSNRAFILRWQNGIDAPLDNSFNIYVEVIIAGIEKVLAVPE